MLEGSILPQSDLKDNSAQSFTIFVGINQILGVAEGTGKPMNR